MLIRTASLRLAHDHERVARGNPRAEEARGPEDYDMKEVARSQR